MKWEESLTYEQKYSSCGVEGEKIKNFSTEEWIEWSKKEKERIEVLEEEARKKFDAEFFHAD